MVARQHVGLRKSLIRRVSTGVVQQFCKLLVGGSNPSPGTIPDFSEASFAQGSLPTFHCLKAVEAPLTLQSDRFRLKLSTGKAVWQTQTLLGNPIRC